MTVYRGRIQLLAKPAAEWTANNPVLLNGEFGVQDPATSAPILKVGDGVRPWSTLPPITGGGGGSTNYVVGSTTTLAPGAFATVTIDNTASPPTISFGIPTGAAGPPNTLAIGTVTTGGPGTPAAATVTGAAPNQTLNLTLPMGPPGPQGLDGADGATGPAGPANTLAIGVVTTGAPGSAAAATITGAAPNQTLNLTIPTGAQGPQGVPGALGPVGPQGPAGDASGMAGADTHVTGEWLFDPTTWFGFTPADKAAMVAAGGIMSADAWEAAAFYGRIKLARTGGSFPVIRASRVNGSFAVPTPILAGESFFGISGGGSTATVGVFGAAEITWTAVENWTPTATGCTVTINAIAPGTAGQVQALIVGGNRADFNVPLFGGSGTWIGAHTFGANLGLPSFATNNVTIGASLGGGKIKFVSSGAVANGRTIEIATSNTVFLIRTVDDADGAVSNILSATRAGLAVTDVSFGNATSNPTYNFLGTGLTNFAGNVAIASVFPLQLIATGARTLDIGSSAANGPYVTCLRSAVPFADFGNAAAVITGGVLDGFAIAPRGAKPIIFGTNGGAECARFGQTGSLQITGAYSGGTGMSLAPGLEIGMGTSTLATVLSYNRGTSTYLALQINCSYCEVSGPGGAELRMQGHIAISDLADNWLRLNNSGSYTNGVYTPGLIQASGGFKSDTGLVGNTFPGRWIAPNNGGLAYGSVYCSGASTGATGYGGYGCADGNLTWFLMGGGGSMGIFIQTDVKWLINRSNTTTAQCDYNFNAPSFTSTSGRAIKRETGAPRFAADILRRLRPIFYRLLAGDSREQLGLIAEEVHALCPQLSDGKTVSYDRLALLLLADWQDQRAAA